MIITIITNTIIHLNNLPSAFHGQYLMQGNSFASYLIFDPRLEPVTLGREAREYYHLPKVNSQTSGGKEVSYFSILDWLQAKSSRCPKNILI
jgi:hypothetical protein